MLNGLKCLIVIGLSIKGVNTCCGKGGYFFPPLPFYIGMLNGSLWIEHIFAVTLKEKDKEKRERERWSITLCFLHYQCHGPVDDHKRGLIVLTAGHRGSVWTEGSATTALIKPLTPVSLPLVVIATRRVKECLCTCWWFLAHFNLCFPLCGKEFKFSYTGRRNCSFCLRTPASLWNIHSKDFESQW